MKTNYLIQACFAFILAGFGVSSCDRKPTVNPKELEEPIRTRADFTIYENVSDSLFVADTVLMYNGIVFKAAKNKKYKSYQWKVGNDERTFDKPSFALRFMHPEGNVDVQLIVTYEPDLINFPDDPGIDTLTKTFHVMDWGYSFAIGKYVGYNVSSPNDVFEFEISREFDVDGFPKYYIRNINKGCMPSGLTWTGGRGARVHRFYNHAWYGDGCKGVDAWAVLTSPDSIEVNYTYGDDTKPFTQKGYPRVKERFIGKRK
ncbi:hypothetical protein H9Q13_07475 [Pontibacter sp. JH31]|uniref:PKD domain-containing protein n=1 Tax=Pontibacter aquaedesilientis TaxID=2766980 RepID=A0ABR7XHU1_9BACT|nr:hypothetical protein [Pontibacter aquaedesilientis]MBD1397001.1 hypothetical protein [Pontibacter aquaedesilientis]